MKKQNHPFHLVDPSPWPLTGSTTMTSGMVMWFSMKTPMLMILGITNLILTMLQWWRDIIREGTYQGKHTIMVTNGLKWGMILFIESDIFFFISFFWGFFHSSLAPNVEMGMTWPPKGIETFNPMDIPLLNTTTLLCSGITITWAHHSIMKKKS